MYIITNNYDLTSGYWCKWLDLLHTGMQGLLNSKLHLMQWAYVIQCSVGIMPTVFTLLLRI